MFSLWHWLGVRGFIRNYFKFNYSVATAETVIATMEWVFSTSRLAKPARDHAALLARRLRKMGCDRSSAYSAAACAYCASAFALDPQRCGAVVELVQDAVDNAEMIHPIAVVTVMKARDEILDAMYDFDAGRSSSDQESALPERQKETSNPRKHGRSLKRRRIAARQSAQD